MRPATAGKAAKPAARANFGDGFFTGSPFLVAIRVQPQNPAAAAKGLTEILQIPRAVSERLIPHSPQHNLSNKNHHPNQNKSTPLHSPCQGVIAMEDDPDTYVDEARDMEFEVVLPGSSTQEETFARTGQPLVTRVIAGYNGCCFTYGQTGSGKTWTMFGSEADPGLVPRMAAGVFAGLARTYGRASPPRQSSVTATYLQVHKEHFFDLLVGGDAPEDEGGGGAAGGAAQAPRVHLGAGGTVELEGAVRLQVTTVAELMVRAT